MTCIINVLSTFSPIVSIMFIYYGIAIKSIEEWPKINDQFNKKYILFYNYLLLWGFTYISLLILLIDTLLFKIDLSYHLPNLLGIFIFFIVMQILRFAAERAEEIGQGKAELAKLGFDLVKDILIFWIAYVSIYVNSYYLRISGLLIAMSIGMAVVKYRIYDDIFKYDLYSKNNKRYVGNHPGHFLIHSFIDHLPRAYLYTAFSFSIIDLLLIKLNPGEKVFNVSSSQNEFVDFFYFNVVTMATVGYGDIFPASQLAKIICAFEIVFTIILMTSIITLILNRFHKIADSE